MYGTFQVDVLHFFGAFAYGRPRRGRREIRCFHDPANAVIRILGSSSP
jgi:hypothetical protein